MGSSMVSNKIIVVLAVALAVALAVSIYFNCAPYSNNNLVLRRFNYSITFVSEREYPECPPGAYCPVIGPKYRFENVLLLPLDYGRGVTQNDAYVYHPLNLFESIGGYLYTDGVISKFNNIKLEIVGPIEDMVTNEYNNTSVIKKTYYRYSGEVDLIYLQGTQNVTFYTYDQNMEVPTFVNYYLSYSIHLPSSLHFP